MAVPLEILALHAGIMLQAVDNAGDAARQRDLGVRHAVAHCVAGPDAHRDPRLIRKLHQLIDKGHHKAVEVRPRHILQVAARHDAGLKRVLHGRKVHLHGFPAGLFQFLEDVIVAAGDQNAGLPDAQIFDRLEIFPAGADPGGDLRELQSQAAAALDGLAVFLGIDEEFGLTDNSIGAAELRHQLEERLDLLRCIGMKGLLPVTEGCIRDPDILRHRNRHAPVVEGDLGDLFVIIDIPVQDRVFDILQRIAVIVLFEQIGFGRQFQHGVPPRCAYAHACFAMIV